MQFRDKDWWDAGVAANTDPYGAAIYCYAERWADLMEAAMANGETLEECADRTSHEADIDGVTGFMHNCAVKSLIPPWIYGEELRRWHNLDVQLGSEGRRANEEGGVLNSAILSIG